MHVCRTTNNRANRVAIVKMTKVLGCNGRFGRSMATAVVFGSAALIAASETQAQSIVSANPVDLAGSSVTFPENGSFFGTIDSTFDGVVITSTDVSPTAPHYGTLLSTATTTPNLGDGVQYVLDADYTPTQFQLWNDANFAAGPRDGIADFTLRFLDDDGNTLGQESFSAANSDVQQNFDITGSYPGTRSFILIIDSTHPRREVQWAEVNLVGISATPDISVASSASGALSDGGSDTPPAPNVREATSITYTITNDGTAPLALAGTPTISGETNLSGPVSVSGPGSLSLAPGESTTFTVTFTVATPDAYGFDIDIGSNDPDEGTFDIAVSGLILASGGALNSAERDAIQQLMRDETERDLRRGLQFAGAANRAARARYADGLRCRRLEDDLEEGLVSPTEFEEGCGLDYVAHENVAFDLKGVARASNDVVSLTGQFFGQDVTALGTRRIVSGEFDVTRYEDSDVALSFDGRLAWERMMSNDVMLATFVGANAVQSNLTGDFSGGRLGFGVNAGAYFVDELSENLYLDGFGSVGAGLNSLDVGNGTIDVDGGYTTLSFLVGLALSGEHDFERFDLRPEVNVSYGYASFGDADVNVSGGGTDVIPGDSVTLGRVSALADFAVPLDVSSTGFSEGELVFTPSVSCETVTSGSSASGCGGGVALEIGAQSNNGLSQFSAGISFEQIGEGSRSSLNLQFEREF